MQLELVNNYPKKKSACLYNFRWLSCTFPFKNVVLSGSDMQILPVPVAARSKAWVCSCSHAGIPGSSPAGSMDVCRVGCVLLEVSARGRSLVQRSHTECDVSNECDRGKSQTRPMPTRGCRAMREIFKYWFGFNRIFLPVCETWDAYSGVADVWSLLGCDAVLLGE
jgi:hypothetical protein